MKADFSGYATKNGLKCSDGRTIMPDAFKHNDQMRVPLVWQHLHNEPVNVLGHAILENRSDGVYAYGFFNNTPAADHTKESVKHGDINALSIYANKLSQQGKNVLHGDIKEVSLVLAGANPGALIDNVNLIHGDSTVESDDEVIIYTGLTLEHADSDNQGDKEVATTAPAAPAGEKTVKDVFETLNEEQKNVVYYLIAQAADEEVEGDDAKHAEELGDFIQHSIEEGITTAMSRNVFEQNGPAADSQHLSHAQVQTIVQDAVKMGSFKESFLSHAGEYGITNIDLLFPDAQAVTNTPDLLARQADWVPKVLGSTKHAPFAKIKSLVADLTAAEARAKGYIKGNMKKDEVVSLMKRTTGPTTIYKKQKLDRDDIIDITDFDVIAWLKWEIRFMLNEELARAILVGDGRESSSDDKIKDPKGANDANGIRSILHDNDLYAHKLELVANVSAERIIDEVARSRTNYRGSGSPTFYTTDTIVTDLLLLKDKMGRRLYETEAALASALRVKEIVPVEVFEEYTNLVGIIVNLTDYTVGTTKGGEMSFFEDFDIDFNQNKYLLETRVSGALTKLKSAIVITRAQGELVAPLAPSFNGATNTITVPAKTGVVYLVNDQAVSGSIKIEDDTEVVATPAEGYYFEPNTSATWAFSYTEA